MTHAVPGYAPACTWHPDRAAVEPCASCGRPICPTCVHIVNNRYLCPACTQALAQLPAEPRPTVSQRIAQDGSYVTLALLAANVVLFLYSVLTSGDIGAALGGQGVGSLLGGNTPLMNDLAVIGEVPLGNGQVVGVGVANGEYYRLFTAMFMHFGLLHLAMNMWALWILGRVLEMAFGHRRFLTLYVLCGLGGNVAAYVFQPEALSAGASTAIFGLFSALFLALRSQGHSTRAVVPIIVLNLIFTFSVPGISIAGHLGGFITGAVVGGGIAYAPVARRQQVEKAVTAGTLAVLVALTLFKTSTIG